MSIISTQAEFKACLPISLSVDIADLQPFIDLAEKKYLIPAIGAAQLNELTEAYVGGTISGDLAKLLTYARMPVACFALLLYIPSGNLQISATGLVVVNNKEKKAAEEWRVTDLEKSLLDMAYTSLDMMLEFMESKAASFTTWQGSEAYTVLKSFFVSTAKEFTSFVNINNSRLTFLNLRATMQKVEDFKIKPILCNPFFNALKAEIKTGTITEANKEVIRLIRAAVAHLTLARGLNELAVKIDENGVTVANTSAAETVKVVTPADAALRAKLIESALEDGNIYLEQLRKLLYESPDSFPLFRDSACFVATGDSQYPNDPKAGIYVF